MSGFSEKHFVCSSLTYLCAELIFKQQVKMLNWTFLLQSESPGLKKSVSQLSLNTPNSNRKRRRLKDTLAQLTRETDMSPFPPRKRPSAEHSLSIGSLLDISNTPESSTTNGGRVEVFTQSHCNVYELSVYEG